MKQETNGGSQTVDRALMVLDTLVSANEPMTLDKLTAMAGLHRSVVYRLLRSLEAAGYVARNEEAGGYGVGPSLLSMSVAIAQRFDIGSFVRPAMDEIVDAFGETVSLHVQSGDRRVCVAVAEGTHPIRRMIPVGESHPVYVGETGRALLALMPDGEVAAWLNKARADGQDADQLMAGVEQARRHGFFIGIGERTVEVGAISVPILGLDGTRYALTVSGPSGRWGDAAMKAAAPTVVALLEPVQRKLSGGGRRTPRRA